MKIVHLKNFRRGLATNSSSTHSLIYRNEGEMMNDLNVFKLDYFGRCDETIAASREAKIKYIFHAIYYNEDLVKILSAFYPEMKQYYSLAKKAQEDQERYDVFGMYPRGCVYDSKNIVFSVNFLRHIIDTDDIIIIGGSDELDFVHDITDVHDQIPFPEDIYEWNTPAGKKNAPVKNGNYYVAFGKTYDDSDEAPHKRNYCFGGRLRFMVEDGEPTPEYPELIDLRITNRCEHGCKFCFMDSNMKEKDADIKGLMRFINDLNIKTEFSIGGGNILLYPELERLLKTLNERGHVVNVTINVKDCDKVVSDKHFKKIFNNYVDGIGVSIFSKEDLKTFYKFEKVFDKIGDYNDETNRNKKYIVAHMVPEYLGYETTMEILDGIRESKKWINVLFLGYKETGRGAKCEHEVFTPEQLKKMTDELYASFAIDTQFAKTYKDFINENFSTRYCLTANEGEYSLYVDATTMKAYKSSYETDKPYELKPGYLTTKTLKEAFAGIRKDNGFAVYQEKHYYDEENK